jgi:hypothetical protein
MVKDFDARFPLKTNMTFMTNGDTPLLALAGLIQNPVNPFTGKVISHEVRKTPARISISPKWMPYEHPHNIFDIDPDEWYDVKDTIFDAGNWRQAEH